MLAAMHRCVMPAVLVAAGVPAIAQQAPEQPRYQLRHDEVERGSRARGLVSPHSPYPLNKPYDRFSEQEKALLRSYYEDMPETDEPPFPAAGMGKIVVEIARLASGLQESGALTLFVRVDEQGSVTHVQVLMTPDPKFAQAVAYIVAQQRFKPGICGGVPCTMEFPLRTWIDRE